MKTTIYFFSGTGNSLFVARLLAKELGPCELLPIPSLIHLEWIQSDCEVIGIVCPTYYIGPPEIVKAFLRKLDVSNARYIFAVPTRGMAIATGTTRHIRDILRGKGKDLDLGMYVTMGQSFTPNHRVPSAEEIAALNAKAEIRIEAIAERIRGRKRKQEFNQGWLLTPLIHPMFMRGIHERDRGMVLDAARCLGCGVCQSVCPVGNVDCLDGRPVWQHRCELCLACVMFCPQSAIEFSASAEGTTAGKPRYRNPAVSLQDLIAGRKTGV
jgi:ferredoxin/flavodoxin